MDHLADVTVEDLQQTLEQIDGKKPAQRLIAAIAYKHGVTQTELAEWFDVERKTIYNWLTRLEHSDVEVAVRDEPRPGRPRKLSADQLDRLKDILRSPPADVGYEASLWSTDLVRQYILDRYDVEYSRPSCRRLMKEVGLRYQRASEAAVEMSDDAEGKMNRPGHVWLPFDRSGDETGSDFD